VEAVLIVVAVLAVLAVAVFTVTVVSGRLANEPAPAVLRVEDAVDWIAERLPEEVTAQLSYDDVKRIVLWHLDWFTDVGLSSDFGEELGAVNFADPVLVEVDGEAAYDFVVERAIRERPELEPVHVVVVLDRHVAYLREIGALGDIEDPGALGDPDEA
jgi:hypothetical protein